MHPFENVALREVEAPDLDTLFAHQLDPEANRMAAFVHEDPTDRVAFDTHWRRILHAPGIVNRTIVADGQIAGHIACFPGDGGLEVTYWLGRAFWGKGIATRALAALLRTIDDRPIFGRAASDNVGSIRVLQKCGFEIVGTDSGFAHGRGAETEEVILRLDGRV